MPLNGMYFKSSIMCRSARSSSEWRNKSFKLQSYHLRNTLALRLSGVFAFLSCNLAHPFKVKALSEIRRSAGLAIQITAWLMYGWSGIFVALFMLEDHSDAGILPSEVYFVDSSDEQCSCPLRIKLNCQYVKAQVYATLIFYADRLGWTGCISPVWSDCTH